ncbi:murein biosynthesis integral membrane protein MurJ [Halorhodospira abdelmalekii]|uniref:murein biosynthesis integral membrane protein MurJ n=1 Tax=Halorhodospira abdelmalekii TaxID=421629 RepID=UPI0019048D42|nr:murein biosynthesis integral membrane protein MurJ [Halorhodospira abdelmalekii]
MVTGLFRHLLTFGSLTFLSRILGLGRDVIIANVFGSGPQTDAFIVAFKIPNFMRRITAEGAFSQAFVPVLADYRAHRSHAEVRALIARTAGTLAVALLVVVIIGIVAAPALVTLFAPGFRDDPERFALTSELLQLTFPYILLISMVACAGAALHVYNRFASFAFAPVLLNATLISAALWLSPLLSEPIVALAIGVAVAGVLQLLLQLPFLAREGLLVMPRPAWRDPGVRRIARLMGPAVLGSSVMQINLLVDTILASFLIAGSVSWLYFSDRLVELPLGVFGIALGTVLLPRLSAEHAATTPEQFSRTLDWGLRLVLVVIAPATAGLIVLAGPILTTLFQYGAFSPSDVVASAHSLAAYSLGLFGFVLVKVLTPGYFSREDMRTPVYCAVVAVIVNLVLSITAVWLLRETAYGHVALAGATAASATVNSALLFYGLRQRGVYRPEGGWRRLFVQVGIATGAMVLVLLYPALQLEAWLEAGVMTRIAWLFAAVGVGAAVYTGGILALGLRLRELREPTADRTP